MEKIIEVSTSDYDWDSKATLITDVDHRSRVPICLKVENRQGKFREWLTLAAAKDLHKALGEVISEVSPKPRTVKKKVTKKKVTKKKVGRK